MRFLFLVCLCALAAFAAAFWLAVPANPEVQFWRAVDVQRDEGIAGIRNSRPDQPVLLFTGGSSCAFSIDPLIVEEACGLPAFNLGLPVSAGPKFLLHQALEKARPGDTLVVCLEPDLLVHPEEFKPGTLSFGLASIAGDPSDAVGASSFGGSLEVREYLNLSRPGPSYLATLVAKKASGTPLYRYTPADLRPHGRVETPVVDPAMPRAGLNTATTLHPGARDLLIALSAAADQRGVRLAYSMPWRFTAEDAAPANRKTNRAILDQIDGILPALDDGYLGVSTDPAHFSDSPLHLSAEGSGLRSTGLAKSLAVWLASGR
jgi:hypothetical protein